MATFNERIALYMQRPDAQHFTRKQIHLLHNRLTWIFNRNRPGYAHKKVLAREGDNSYWVRDYPAAFTPTIDGLINRLHDKVYKPPVPKQRTRKPVKPRPVFSSSKP